MLQDVPAFIMRVLFAALFYPAPVRQRGLRFALPSALRGTSGSETMTTPGGAGTPRKAHLQLSPCSAHRLLSYGRSSHTGLRPFALPRSYAAGRFLFACWIDMHGSA
jgi:hypothetical protein